MEDEADSTPCRATTGVLKQSPGTALPLHGQGLQMTVAGSSFRKATATMATTSKTLVSSSQVASVVMYGHSGLGSASSSDGTTVNGPPRADGTAIRPRCPGSSSLQGGLLSKKPLCPRNRVLCPLQIRQVMAQQNSRKLLAALKQELDVLDEQYSHPMSRPSPP